MAETASYEWRVTVIPTGEVLQTARAYTSPEEALSAAKEHAVRSIEPDFDLHVAVLDNEEKVVSELEGITAGDLAKSSRTSKNRRRSRQSNGANLGFEETLWQAADRMRGHMDPAEYKHVALGLIFLKYISDAFDERYGQLELWTSNPQHEYYVKEPQARYEVLEDRDEYKSENVFWVPKEARWANLQANAKQPTIGRLIDDAMVAIERENPSLKGVLPKDYARPALDKQRLGELIDLVGTIGLGDRESRSKDILGRVYEYFLSKFASAEGKKGGEFYTPRCVVRLLVAMIEPYKGRVYDPCCGSSGMFVQSEEFIKQHGGRIGDIAVYGQESNPTTWRIAKMNLAIRSIEANLGPYNADTFSNDLHKDLKADFILANPPFNMSYWGGENLRDDVRWKYGTPPTGNANYAWIQHMIHHLSPRGIAGFVLSNGSMSSNQSGEGEIRRRIVEADLMDCMIALPPQLFYGSGIPACLWFLARDKRNGKFRDRRGETLFIDARKLGHLVDRVHRELSDKDIAHIADTYHAWRGEKDAGDHEDTPGFCKSATTDEVSSHGFVLTPGRYVGAEDIEDDDEPFGEKMVQLTAKLEEEFAESARIENEIRRSLRNLDNNL
ncbi:MAG: SAM-dependent DNA methyltransferase [Chloroflexi bacterium]|nr:SAM-dependent DNA methyltransferase [Chloroflexota bacterium]